jgi:hypothetical protein
MPSETGSANAADDNHFNSIARNNPSNYLYQLESNSGFYAAYQGRRWQAEADRVDGACPIANPTTAEVLQWGANKWGINPLLLYAVATNESSWDQTGMAILAAQVVSCRSLTAAIITPGQALVVQATCWLEKTRASMSTFTQRGSSRPSTDWSTVAPAISGTQSLPTIDHQAFTSATLIMTLRTALGYHSGSTG